ncbi:SusD-like starch-binding protein associating with outer membrane [Arcticibacter tournemirensis]|uniref:SusD/RagB family nutrient-binding outer membrane lipoprotein n=1 Tax=Arcticibacter tournemirensis TaxID=699437 RepID=A0A5M9HBK1_9SPHI|nr:SusD/RagB family nutrient-binding outer membrane lipoprotein [Arcticibacter tournemirensis]KAA8484372.1 SusD/RagB family nutrient-binding outer membrane lipoprotein [Arcticibacter tournemirensis]TQM49812.1 SusD-like starch-binding protein associating with outer membrane [Arcticibacter tournemirensis]
MKKYILYTLFFILTVSSFSCKDGFKDLSINPNTSEFVLPQALLAPALVDVVAANMNRSRRITNELMQVTVDMGDSDGKIFRYEIRKSEADYLWNAWYTQLTNFNDIYTGGRDNLSNTYMGIARICQAWIFSMLTDTYGDVPYFNANKGREGNITPAFDRQKDIYEDIFTKLEEANQLLDAAEKAKETVLASSDPIYGGSPTKWRRFGNSLYLRLLLRVSGKSEIDAVSKIKEIVQTNSVNYPIMASNDDSAILRWTGVSPLVTPFVDLRDADWYTPKSASFFVDNLVEWGDPRISSWVTMSRGEYVGIQSGYPVGEAPEGRSSLVTALKSSPLLGNIMNYSELQFILAEAATRGWITTQTAQSFYEAGITSGIAMWGATMPANYLQGASIMWDNDFSLDSKLELIHVQKYYSLFFTDLQSWFEYRRTGHPNLPIGPGVGNNGAMPSRISYPVYVQSTNGENYKAAVASQGPDDISTKVWWQKP